MYIYLFVPSFHGPNPVVHLCRNDFPGEVRGIWPGKNVYTMVLISYGNS